MSGYLYSVDDNSEELMHYGVLGMKWHHRKAGIINAKAADYRRAANNPNTGKHSREYYHMKADKLEAKRDQHLSKNKENLSNNPNIRKGERYTKLTKGDRIKGGVRYVGGVAAGSAAAYAVGSVAGNSLYRYGEARSSGRSRKESLREAGNAAKEVYNYYSKGAVNASKKVKNARQNFGNSIKNAASKAKSAVYNSSAATNVRRHKYANAYGLPGPTYVNVKYKNKKK